jgi:amino acid adenylation domain-containing protein
MFSVKKNDLAAGPDEGLRAKMSLALPPKQQAIRDKCFHPSGTFIEFLQDEVEQSIPQRFETIVGRYPDRLAVKDQILSWTYNDLNRFANRVARLVLDRCGDETAPIALVADNDCRTIGAYLGLLKAGKIAVVIDPSDPRERAAHFLANSQARFLVSTTEHLEHARSFTERDEHVLCLAAMEGVLGESNVKLKLAPDATVQIIYTSGSTGQPKGVFLNHRRILYDVMEDINAAHTCPDDRMAQFRKLTFSWGIKDLFRGLLSGAAVLLYDLQRNGVTTLPAFLVDQGITIFRPSVSMYRQLVHELSNVRNLSPVRLLTLTDGAITAADVDAYKRLFPEECLLLHQYSCSEAGLLCFNFIDKKTEIATNIVPVGYPVPGKDIFLVDEQGAKITCDGIGEIVVRSRYVSSGYWSDKELSDAKFQTDPLSDGRICLTGDLGRILSDGCLVHLGRKDLIHKIRGYRVELGEVERGLLSHPEVKEAAAAAWERGNGEKYFVGYLVTRSGANLKVGGITKFLRQKFPDYMIPSVFVFLDSLPLTNGKLDRSALPRPGHTRPNLEMAFAAPTSEIEHKITEIWSDVLGIVPVGIDDDFFDLGGHSLLAVKLFARLDEAFGRLLPLSVLFEAPTIRALAARYEAAETAMPSSNLITLRRGGTLPPIYAVPGVFGNVVGFADLSRELGPEQPFFGFNAVGLDTGEAPLESIEAIARRNVSEIRSVHRNGPFALIGACFGAPVAYEMARQLTEAGEEVAFLGLLDPVRLKKTPSRKHSVPTPWAYKRAKAVASLVADRLRLYGQEIRGHSSRERLNYLVRKIRSLGGLVAHNKGIKGVARELYQLEVYRANHRASRLYALKPINGRLKAFEIFQSSHPRNNAISGVQWASLWQGAVVRHKVPGKDSGDMLSGENARVLAELLAERIRKAIESPMCQREESAAVVRGQIETDEPMVQKNFVEPG